MLVKPNCVSEAVFTFVNFQNAVYISQLFVYNISKKYACSQTHFGFTTSTIHLYLAFLPRSSMYRQS